MLESLYRKGKLRTEVAVAIIHANLAYRKAQGDFAKTINKAVSHYKSAVEGLSTRQTDIVLLKEAETFFDAKIDEIWEIQKKYAPDLFRDILTIVEARTGEEYRQYLQVKTTNERALLSLAKGK